MNMFKFTLNVFQKKHQNKNIDELSDLLLEYFLQFENCSEAKKFGEYDLILLISGWDNGLSKIYKISTRFKSKELIKTEKLIAEGLEITFFKNQFNDFLQILDNKPLLSMEISFALVTNALKCSPFLSEGEKITCDKMINILKTNKNLENECAPVDKPYDSVILFKDGRFFENISKKD